MTIQGTGLGGLPTPPDRYERSDAAQMRSIIERNFRQLNARLRASVIAADADETITGQWTFDQTIIGDISGDADTVDGEHASAFADAGHTHAAGDIISGTFVDARIAQSNVTQHEGALIITESQISDLAHTTPAGVDGEIQYNDGGSFGGSSTLHWDDVNSRLGIGLSSPSSALEVSGTVDATQFTEGGSGTLSNDITGDADTVDGYHGGDLAARAETETITGAWTIQGNLTIDRQISYLSSSGLLLTAEGGGADTWLPSTDGDYYLTANESMGTPGAIHLRRWNSTDGYVEFAYFGADKGYFTGGNFGIGTATPSGGLEVTAGAILAQANVGGTGPTSDGAVRNIVHAGTGPTSATGIEGTVHTSDA